MAILMAIASIIVLFGKNSEFDRKFGELSFPIYISHTLVSQIYGFVITGATKKFPILGNNAISVWTQVSAVLIVSYVLLQITKPVERLRDKNRILN